MTKEEKLIAYHQNFSNLKIENVIKSLNSGWNSSGLWQQEEKYALYSFFILDQINSAKQHFFLCGKVDEFEITKLDSPILDYGLNHISYALLSDCKELIATYANLTHSYYAKSIANGSATASYIIQCIIKDDWPEYERVLPIMKTRTLKKYPVMKWDLDFFEGMAARNKTKIEAALAGLVSSKVHKQRNRLHILLNEFISHPALGYAKLALLKGVEVEVNSPLVPKELLPVRPLEVYVNEYAFLNEIELPVKK